MTETSLLTFPGFFEQSVQMHGNSIAFSYVDEEPITYAEASHRIKAAMAFLEKLGVEPGDRIAILSTNMPNWVIAYFAITFMGAVAVPVLPDFTSKEVENILNHSAAKGIFVSDKLRDKIQQANLPACNFEIAIEHFTMISGQAGNIFKAGDVPANNYQPAEDDLAAIIYTSGTTGQSKGVMLSHKNICSNAIAGSKVQPIDENDRFLSVLPLSHTYENTLGLILPVIFGSSVYYLKEKPVASVLLPAMEKVRPTMMLTVPLIIEKVYRNKIIPALTSKIHLRMLYQFPFMRKKMHEKAGKKLMESFGGKLKFFGIGGAKLDREVEKFLIEAKFPYAIGYGLTESSPLLAGVNPQQCRLQTTGPAVEGVELKLDQQAPDTGIGEILARGPNIMQGYYKDPEETRKVITEDGWLKTGDLGMFDKDGYLYIKGRSKNVIVGANGENVYPEEIESLINNYRHVAESIVLNQKGKLVALVHLNMEELEKRYQNLHDEIHNHLEEKKQELQAELLDYVNSRVNHFSRLKMIVLQTEPFHKTPTQKIKRYLYS
ncbi:MAG: AMP-binding protein [Bacteroidota bacterium]|nr:AMP-binding protein [Bacteroidota bacterium]